MCKDFCRSRDYSQTRLPSPSASWSACRLFKQPTRSWSSVVERVCLYWPRDGWLWDGGWHPLNWALYDRVHCRCACCVFRCSKSAPAAIGGSAAIYTLPQLQWLSSPSASPFRKNRRRGDFEATQSFIWNSLLFLFVYSFHHCFASCQLCRYLWKQPSNYLHLHFFFIRFSWDWIFSTQTEILLRWEDYPISTAYWFQLCCINNNSETVIVL